MGEVSLSWVPSVSKKTVLTGFFITGWSLILLIAATGFGLIAYAEIKYMFWIIPITLPAWILLESRSTPRKLSAKDEKLTYFAGAVTCVALISVFLEAILQGSI